MTHKEQVLKLITEWDKTALEISQRVNFPIATVHKRINDLYNDGLIRQTGKFITTTDSLIYAIYELTPFCKIQETIIKRRNQLNIDWILQGYSKKHISKDQRDQMLYNLTIKMNGSN